MPAYPSLTVQLTDKLLQQPLTGGRPISSADGVDLSTWKMGGGYGPRFAAIYFDGSSTSTITAPTGGTLGVELWGFKLGQWWLIDSLNAGAPIPIASDALGATEQVDGIGGFDRLFVAGTASAGAVLARFVPLEVLR